jgi:hypothetical protein
MMMGGDRLGRKPLAEAARFPLQFPVEKTEPVMARPTIRKSGPMTPTDYQRRWREKVRKQKAEEAKRAPTRAKQQLWGAEGGRAGGSHDRRGTDARHQAIWRDLRRSAVAV